MRDREIEKIKVLYSDGTEKEIKRAMLVDLGEKEADYDKDEELNIVFEMLDINHNYLKFIINAVIELGNKLGFFEDTEYVIPVDDEGLGDD